MLSDICHDTVVALNLLPTNCNRPSTHGNRAVRTLLGGSSRRHAHDYMMRATKLLQMRPELDRKGADMDQKEAILDCIELLRSSATRPGSYQAALHQIIYQLYADSSRPPVENWGAGKTICLKMACYFHDWAERDSREQS